MKLMKFESFTGTRDRTSFECASWSPMGITSSGASLLAISAHSDMSVSFKLFECKAKLCSADFVEVASLVEILREYWLTLPLFQYGHSLHAPVTETYQSLSLCLDGFVQKSMVKWSPVRLSDGSGVLFTSWGAIAIVWKIFERKQIPLLALQFPSADFTENPVQSISINSLECDSLIIEATLFDETVSQWTVTFVDSAVQRVSSELIAERVPEAGPHKVLNYKDFTSETIPGGMSLGACSSPNGAFDFVLRRTSRSVQLFSRLSEPFTVSAILQRIIDCSGSNKPLLDLAAALTSVYRARPGKLSPISVDDPLESTLTRFLHGETQVSSSHLTRDIRLKLAFALHALHSRIDTIAASAPRTRQSERKILMHLIGMRGNRPVSCTSCGASECSIDDDLRKAACMASPNHSFLLCQKTMEPLNMELAIECSFCSCVSNLFAEQKPVAICSICRIGFTRPF